MNIFGLIDIPNWLLIIIILGVAFYIWLTWTFNRFSSVGIPGPKAYPIIGTAGPIFTEGVINSDRRRYKEYGRIYGTFLGRRPIFIIGDDELLSEILVKKFWCFPDRRQTTKDGTDIVDNFLVGLTGEKWKRIRNLMTPTFTSGKLKAMTSQLNTCARDLTENIILEADNNYEFNIKQISACYTMDVIGSTAFGLEVNSQKDPDNEFVKMGNKAFNVNLRSPLVLVSVFMPFLIPLVKKISSGLIAQDAVDFFVKVTKEAIKERKANPNRGGRTDFIQLMINAHNESVSDVTDQQEIKEFGATYDGTKGDKGMTDLEITAQGVLFFMAGFDTTAQTLAFLFYRLALHQDIQEKLRQEITSIVGDRENIEYNEIMQMKYLDMCIKETMRMYPQGALIDRECVEDVTIKDIQFKKGDLVAVPIASMHYDDKRWKEPEEFRPERFTPEESAKRGPFDWMPFGYGPRNCIGMRLALLEAKMAVAHSIRKVKFVKCDRTKVPLKMEMVGYRVKEGIWITAVQRQ